MKKSKLSALAIIVLAAFTVGISGIPASAVESDGTADSGSAQDPALTQVVAADEKFAEKGNPVEISAGHVDLGPKIVDGKWEFFARDDTAATPIWRHLDDVVFRVSDAAKMPLPKNDNYSFIKADHDVLVIPQQELPNVVWLGWNTQSPEVVSGVNGGVSLIFGGHQGPGDFHVFVQAGNFSGPQQLWNSTEAKSQPIHVELNTHTHANWVFTEPGVHLVRLTAQAQLTDGTTVEDTKVLRFAVGSNADAQQALETQWAHEENPVAPVRDAQPSAVDENNSLPLYIALGLVVLALVVVGIGVVLARRTKRAQREAEVIANSERSAFDTSQSDEESLKTTQINQS